MTVHPLHIRHARRVTKHGLLAWYLYALAIGVMVRAALMLVYD